MVPNTLLRVLALFTVDRLGRKPFMLWGAVCQALMFLLVAVLLGTAPPENKTLSWLTEIELMTLLWPSKFCMKSPRGQSHCLI